MARYIDAQNLKKRIERYPASIRVAAMNAIAHTKTEDVVPVRHGKNIYNTVPEHCEFKCSVCGAEISSVYGGDNDCGLDGGYFNYCPNCGAKMDGEA